MRIDVVEERIQAAGDAVADLIETAGNAVHDATVPWPGGIVPGVTNLAGAVVKGLFGVAGAAAGGVLKIVTGRPRAGAIDIGSSIAGALIVFGGTLLALVQRVFFLQNGETRLTSEEAARLREVFGDSLSLYNIRVIRGRGGIFDLSGRAFTLGNTIYMKRETRPSVLVHECVHVWQYQNLGPRYAADALAAQLVHGMSAYDWREEEGRGHATWRELNREAQAEHIEDVVRDDIRTPFATASLAALRGQLNARWSRRLRAPAPRSEG